MAYIWIKQGDTLEIKWIKGQLISNKNLKPLNTLCKEESHAIQLKGAYSSLRVRRLKKLYKLYFSYDSLRRTTNAYIRELESKYNKQLLEIEQGTLKECNRLESLSNRLQAAYSKLEQYNSLIAECYSIDILKGVNVGLVSNDIIERAAHYTTIKKDILNSKGKPRTIKEVCKKVGISEQELEKSIEKLLN